MTADPNDSALDNYLYEQEERSASATLDEVLEGIRALEVKAAGYEASASSLEVRVREMRRRPMHPGDCRECADLLEGTRTHRVMASTLRGALTELKRVLNLD